MLEKTKAADMVTAGVGKNGGAEEMVTTGGVFYVTCRDADGNLKWEDEFHNLVVNVGLQDINNKYFTGTTYTAAWYIGLVNATATYAAGDTAALHGGWTENTSYSQAARPTLSFGASTLANPSVITASAATFSMNATATIGGAFVISNSTKGGTTGILFSEGNFVGGSKTVASGDTLNVTYSLSTAG